MRISLLAVGNFALLIGCSSFLVSTRALAGPRIATGPALAAPAGEPLWQSSPHSPAPASIPHFARFSERVGGPAPPPAASRDAIWSEPPDLNGLIGSSEQILAFGLETEIANDFIPSQAGISRATFWGGYYNNTTPCMSGIRTPGFNLEFFEDAGCIPGQMIANFSVTQFSEESIGCQGGMYPIFKWSAPIALTLTAGDRYWFCPQIKDHPFPPQGGRLATRFLTGCDSCFRSAYFGYPDWVVACDFGFVCDFSQEFEGLSTEQTGACCLPNDSCVIVHESECAQSGVWQGFGTTCTPDACRVGACCRSDGTCVMTTEFDCGSPSTWQGLESTCVGPSCVTYAPGSIFVWGRNNYGQCDVPQPDQDFTLVAAGGFHSLARTRAGAVIAWGRNDAGQCDVPELHGACTGLAAGWGHSLVLLSDGSIVAWGRNTEGQCDVPQPDTGFVAVAAGGYHSLALRRDGSIVAWGRNDEQQCDVPSPNSGYAAVAGGGFHSLALRADGSIAAWGLSSNHQCDVPAPNTGFTAVAAGWRHSLGLKMDGSVVAWGRNDQLQCLVPDPNRDFVAIAGGSGHSLGLKSDGSAVAWGSNDYGQRNSPLPNRIYVAVSAGSGYDSYALARPLSIACCRADGTCTLTTPDACEAIGGTPAGDGLTCDPNPCGLASADESARGGKFRIAAAPNPTGGATLLLYEIPRATRVTVEVYDAAGRVVRRFPLGLTEAGAHSLPWDGRDRAGRVLPAGIYMTRITTDAGARTGRFVILGR